MSLALPFARPLSRPCLWMKAQHHFAATRYFRTTTGSAHTVKSSSSGARDSTVVAPATPSLGRGDDREGGGELATDQSWSEEWRSLGLGARLPRGGSKMTKLLFVQIGFGVDQHGDRRRGGATKAAVRAVRNAIEFNSIPGAITCIPGGRGEMLIQVRLGVPPKPYAAASGERIGGGDDDSDDDDVDENDGPMEVDLSQVAKVFPYGRLLPIEVVVGGLSFPTGRIVHELGDEDDVAVCCAACVSIGYDDGSVPNAAADGSKYTHETYSTKDGY